MTIERNWNDWTGVAAIPTFADDLANGRGTLNNTARVKLAWDATYPYTAYTVTDTEILAVQTTRDGADVDKEDAVKLHIDPQGDGGSASYMATTDYEFIASARNLLADLSGNGTGRKTFTYRGTTGAPTLLTTVASGSFQNTALTGATTYRYQVAAVDAAGNDPAKTTA